MQDNLGFFTYFVNTMGKSLHISSRFSIEKGSISRMYYPTLKNFYSLPVKKQSEPIVLKKNNKKQGQLLKKHNARHLFSAGHCVKKKAVAP